MKKIAIFQYEWPLQVHTLNLVAKLAERGWYVDLFLKDCNLKFVDLDSISSHRGIVCHDFSSGFSRKIWQKIMMVFGYNKMIHPAVLPKAVSRIVSAIKGKEYSCFIGVEKKGLIWAGRVAEQTGTPVIYYSLELYLEDHPAFINDPSFPVLREEEIKYHQKTIATIIQDEKRADVLLTSNNHRGTNLLFMPVSIFGGENRKRTDWLYCRKNIHSNRKIILYFGMIDFGRGALEMANASNYLDPEWIMVFHGFGSHGDVKRLSDADRYPNLLLSLELVQQKEIRDLIASATIGLVYYGDTCNNDKLTAFSSEKLALYLQSGIPLIVYDIGNYRDLIDRFQCGELVASMDELPLAVRKIWASYEKYSENAFAAFNELYRFEAHFEKIARFIETGLDRLPERVGND